jgi:hypothetical protein
MICPQCEIEIPAVKWKRPDVIKLKMPSPHKGPCGLACRGGMMPKPILEGPFHVKEGCVTCAKKALRAATAALAPPRVPQIVQAPNVAAPVPPPSAKAKAKA